MALPPLLEEVRKRPGMFLPKVEFDVVAAFIHGFNLAGNSGLLAGFHEWLVVRLGYGDNLTWPGLVLHLAFPDAESVTKCLQEEGNQKRAIDSLFNLLEEFWQERTKRDGLRRIFFRYEEWLQQQDWYDATSPEYLEPATTRRGRKKRTSKSA